MCLTSLFPSAGCPNGCARPYMAELGFVGDGPNSYQVRFCTSHMGVVQPVCSKQEMLLPLQLGSAAAWWTPACNGMVAVARRAGGTRACRPAASFPGSPAHLLRPDYLSTVHALQIWLGGSLNATRLAEPFAERVKAKVGDKIDGLFDRHSGVRPTSARSIAISSIAMRADQVAVCLLCCRSCSV